DYCGSEPVRRNCLCHRAVGKEATGREVYTGSAAGDTEQLKGCCRCAGTKGVEAKGAGAACCRRDV
ncbi:MAG: hypothetical protein ACYST5_22315, partial [Planctomycetota bacterium]